ncbi:SET and MYND domain-containing protein 5 [Belonocnema kinseyi]|uniref:SET and MYND domain-containing protein 5 n=1 Tax=Belonocnema kinseyi TaxID=2817044 RepID=UPI00143CF36D|nr:SET and MYND domain-containing protein 5 [Belonocnema kinseyi]
MEKKGIQVRITGDDKGKGLFALRSYKEGETILEEKPLVCCQYSWNADYGYSACENCLSPLETAQENVFRLCGKRDIILPYPECCETKKEFITDCETCGVKYCSSECKSQAFQRYHQTLCLQSREKDKGHPLVQLNEIWKQLHYPPETATIMLVAKMVALVNQSPDGKSVKSAFSQFCHRTTNETQEIAHKLLGEKFIEQIDLLRETTKNVLNVESVEDWFTPDGFKSLLALIGVNGQGIGTSAFSRWVNNVSALDLSNDQRIQVDELIDRIYKDMDDAVGLSFLNNEGTGLYSLQSTINHSCDPNAVVELPHSNSTLVVKATREIQPEEEICIAYLDECLLERSRHSRQKVLSSLYLFICQCNKCLSQSDDPDLTSDSEEYSDEDMSD